jgi:hypothetical protein
MEGIVARCAKGKINGKASDGCSKQGVQGNQPRMSDYLLLFNVLKAPGHDQ